MSVKSWHYLSSVGVTDPALQHHYFVYLEYSLGILIKNVIAECDYALCRITGLFLRYDLDLGADSVAGSNGSKKLPPFDGQ